MNTVKRLKVVKFTMRHKLEDVEETVNGTIDELLAKGYKIINITPMFVPTTTYYIVYNIVYEAPCNAS